MIRMFTILTLVFLCPFVLLGLSLRLPGLVLVGFLVVLSGILAFSWSAFSVYSSGMDSERIRDEAGEDLNRRLFALWKKHGPEKVGVEFYRYRSTRPEFRVWAHQPRRVAIFLSLGFLEQMTDHDLQTAFRRIAEGRMGQVIAGNRREAFRMLLERWKGSESTFRYWFFSFWLYPLERLLNIARI